MDKADHLTEKLDEMIVLSDVSDMADNDKMRKLADALLVTSLKDIHTRLTDADNELTFTERLKANEQFVKFATVVEKRIAVDKAKKPKIKDSKGLALGERRLKPINEGDEVRYE